MTDPSLFPAEILESCRSPVPREDLFVVLAYNANVGYWSIRKGEYTTEEEARKAGAQLSPVWNEVFVVRIPGNQK